MPHPVAPPVLPPEEVPQIEAGQRVTIDGSDFGSQTGRVVVVIGSLQLEARVEDWTSHQVTAILPELPLAGSARAVVQVLTSYGHPADRLTVELVPGRSVPVDGGSPVSDTNLPAVVSGQQITLESPNLGQRQGSVQILVSGLTLNADVRKWSETEATAVLPSLSLTENVKATIQLVDANGKVANQIDVLFGPAAKQVAIR